MTDASGWSFEHLLDVPLVTLPFPPGGAMLRVHVKGAGPLAPTSRPARFSDPLAPPAGPRFGGIYAAADFATAFVETLVRDAGDLLTGRFPLPLRRVKERIATAVTPTSELRLLSLLGDAPFRMRIPGDTVRASSHVAGRKLAEMVWLNFRDIDGIIYPSRFTTAPCVMIYDRALGGMRAGTSVDVLGHPEVDGVLDHFAISLIDDPPA